MNAKTNFSSNTPANFSLAPIAWALALVGALFFLRLGDRPFRNPDEGRYAEIAHEMVASGDWVKPTVFGLGYLRKPPLFYWLIATSFRLFGENELSARAVPALFGVLGVLLVFWFGNLFFDRSSAFAASLILGTNLWFVQVGRYLVIDAVYSFFLTAALFFFYAAMQSQSKKNIFPILFFGSLGCAFLTKGPSSLVIVGFPALAYLFWSRRWNIFKEIFWWVGLGLFFLIVLPWFVQMAGREVGFLDFFFLHEHVQRFIATDFEHQEPWFYYLVVLPLLFLPWSLYRRTLVSDEKSQTRRFLICAVLFLVVFFSFSRSKLPTYLLPCFPLMALLAADSWTRWIDSKAAPNAADFLPVVVLCFVSLILVTGAPVFVQTYGEKYPPALVLDLQILGGIGLAGSVVAARSLKRGQKRRFFLAFIFMMAAFSLGVSRVMETMNPAYSTKNFADKLRLDWREEEIFVYDHPGPFYDFAFYLKRPVKLVGLEGELAHSRLDAKASEVSISREEFFSKLREKKPLVALMRQSDFFELDSTLRDGVQILKQDDRKGLIRSGTAKEGMG